VATAARDGGRLDLLVNAAGIWTEGPSDQASEAEWNRVIDVNLKGTFFLCRHAIPHLEKTGGGIINISSDAGIIGSKGAAIYCASKGGVNLLTKSLARELAPRGIRVNAICPCDTATPMIEYQAENFGGGYPEGYKRALLAIYPQGERARFATAEEIAAFVFFVASPEAAPITGACLSIDFGTTAGV
jgi:NAD(P)-dependent dehydrogenase (short-subunit alcohol dehydrogenase family)